jgi:hypothetical protein
VRFPNPRRPGEGRDPYVDGPRGTRAFWQDRIACIHMSGLLGAIE